jgi:HK97 family phage major capsid protein/HK97 family phage prohead protease
MTTHKRSALFDCQRAQDNRVPVVVSSTEPVDRGGVAEILSHDPKHVDLSRAPLPLLVSHEWDMLPIGVVEDLRLDGGKLRGMARFSDNEKAQTIFADIKAGILRSVSVGYRVTEQLSRSATEMLCAWQPFEVSCVSVPADRQAGFFRSERITVENETNEQNPTRSERRAASREQVADLERRDQIRNLADAYARYIKPGDAAAACQRGDSVDDFKEYIMGRMQTGHTDTGGAQAREWTSMGQQFSLGRAIGNVIDPGNRAGGLEREMSDELARSFGRNAAPGGFYVPDTMFAAAAGRGRELRAVSIGTAATGGGALHVGGFHGEMFADAFRANTVIGQLGATIMPNQTSDIIIPRKTAVSTMGWVTEVGTAAESTPDFDQLTLKPKRISTYVIVSQQALIQSGLALENLLRDDLVTGAMVEIDRVALRGAGTGSEPTGLINVSGVGTVTGGSNGAAITFGHLVDLEAQVAIANALPGSAGYVLPPKVRQYLRKSAKVGGGVVTELAWDDGPYETGGIGRVAGYRAGVTNNLRSNLTKGTSTTVCSELMFGLNWAELIVAKFGGNEIIVDPYTLAKTGQVQITLNNFVDVGVRRAAAFAKMTDALTA